jgi:hypothetical protein
MTKELGVNRFASCCAAGTVVVVHHNQRVQIPSHAVALFGQRGVGVTRVLNRLAVATHYRRRRPRCGPSIGTRVRRSQGGRRACHLFACEA